MQAARCITFLIRHRLDLEERGTETHESFLGGSAA